MKHNQDESTNHRTTVAQTSERERTITRTFNAPVHLVFEAWSKPELFRRWWVPRSMPFALLACEMDVRVGGKYRLSFGNDSMPPIDFFGSYIDVMPNARLVWTNEESGDNGSTTTVTFAALGEQTTVVVSELYPSKEALDADEAHEAAAEVHAQLDELLASLAATPGAR